MFPNQRKFFRIIRILRIRLFSSELLALAGFLGYINSFEKIRISSDIRLYNVKHSNDCSFFNQMARKKRVPEAEMPAAETKEKVQYQDAFQQTVTKRVGDLEKSFEGQGRTLMYGIGAVVAVAVVIGIFMLWSRSSESKAQTAFGKAIETSQAVVSSSPLPAGSTIRSFKTEKERAEAAVAEFDNVAKTYGGSVGEKAKFMSATMKLSLDRAAATTELEALAGGSGDTSLLAKYALAQVKSGDGKLDEAATLYQALAGVDSSVISKDSVKFELAKILEKQNKKDEAVNLYFEIAKAAAEAKDADGKPITMGTIATDAKKKVEELAPEKAKELPKPEVPSPLGLN